MAPWSNQTGGGGNRSSGNGGGPWGQGPRGTGPQPPDLEELLRRSQDRLRRVLPGGGGRGLNPAAIVGIAAIVAALAVYYFFTFRVELGEVGVVTRFGVVDRVVQPGLNFRLPYPIESVYKPQVTLNRVTAVGYVPDERNPTQAIRDLPAESLMLTGDENIVDVDFSVVWLISNPTDYLFNIQNPEGTVKAVAESAMREVVGRSNITPLLTQARQITQSEVQTLMQTTLDAYGAGVQILEVQLQKVDPPAEVIAAFRDVQAARADQERLQNEARTYRDRVIPQARGQAQQIIESAIAYRDRVIADAQGQADRFTQVYEAYRLAPDVTRQRIYLETLAQIMQGMSKVIIDENGMQQGVVPYLPLNELPRLTTPATPNAGVGAAR
jgi:membrane protease subunit HflK